MATPVSEQAFSTLRLRQLQLVCLLSEMGSMRAASERMHLSAPALSKSLREVERLAGTDLFERSTHGVKPTAAGEAFVRHARGILDRVPGLRNSGNEKHVSRGTFKLGMSPFLARQLLPPALLSLSAKESMPRINLVEGRIIPLAELLLNGDLDAVITLITHEALEVFGPERGALLLEEFHAEPLLVVAPAGERVTARRMAWKELLARPWILPPPGYASRAMFQRAFLTEGLVPPEPAIESMDIPLVLALVRSGLGVTPAFECTVREDLRAGSLQRIRMKRELLPIPIGLAYRKSSSMLSIVHALRAALKEQGGSRP
jgi:DNA-binding transcriptional LysR family regulator